MSMPPKPPTKPLKSVAPTPAVKATAPPAKGLVKSRAAGIKKKAGPPRAWTLSDCQGFWYIYAPHWEARTAGLIVALENTFVKRTTAYSWELPEWEKREIKRGGELRIDGAPVAVTNPKEKNRHKWTHLHRRVHLGEIERCKAELLDARAKLVESQKRLQQEREDDQALAQAKKELADAKASVDQEMSLRKKMGLPVDVDPFSESFVTSPAPGGGAAATSPPCASQAAAEAETQMTPAADADADDAVVRHWTVRGNVQGVCFRMTLARAALARNVEAGATNMPDKSVAVTLSGSASKLDALENDLRTISPLNSMGATVLALETATSGQDILAHQVNSSNVSDTEWADIERFL